MIINTNFILAILMWVTFMWVLDSFLNAALARKMGENKIPVFFIPLYGYYRFGRLVGIHPIIIMLALVLIILNESIFIHFNIIYSQYATFIFHFNITYCQYLLIRLASILANTIIVYFIAERLLGLQLLYPTASFTLGLLEIVFQVIFVVLFNGKMDYNGAIIFPFVSFSLMSTVVQLPKIILAIKKLPPRQH